MSIPLAAYFKLSFESFAKFEEKIEKMSHVLYSNAIISLMYAMVCTQSNHFYAVSVVSYFVHNPSKDHSDAVK